MPSLRKLFRQEFQGHEGRPGFVGGSKPRKGSASESKIEPYDENQKTNSIIESVPFIVRQLDQYGAGVNMADQDYRDLVGKEFVDFFTVHPFGETEKYIWETVKVDQLNNLKIEKKKVPNAN